MDPELSGFRVDPAPFLVSSKTGQLRGGSDSGCCFYVIDATDFRFIRTGYL